MEPWTPQWEDTYDFAIVGSGGGSMCTSPLYTELAKATIVARQALVGGFPPLA